MIIKNLLSVSKKFGGKTGQMQQVEFFFYADSQDKASNLAIKLSNLGYKVYGVEKSRYKTKDDKWSIIGATSPMIIDEPTLTKWTEAMLTLADEMDVEYDGCGMMLEK